MYRRSTWRLAAASMACTGFFLAGPGLAADEAWTLDPDGFGPLHIGMSFAQARQVAGDALQPTDPARLPTRSCDQLPLPGHPGVALMFVGGVLHRIDVFEPGIRAGDGLGVGDPAAQVGKRHPRMVRTPNAYDARESYLTVGPEHGRALRFETAEGRIVRIIAGDWAQVQYVEGCL